MNTHFRQFFGNTDFVVFGEDNSRLLLSVPKGNIMDLYLFRYDKIFLNFIEVVPGADKPIICFPWCFIQDFRPPKFYFLRPAIFNMERFE